MDRLKSLVRQLTGGSRATEMSNTQKELEEALTQGVKDGKVPQAVVYATNADGSFQYSFAAGTDQNSNPKPISKDAVFMLASQTKLLTSIAALQAVEQGVLTLDEDVTSHIPELSKHGILTGFDDSGKPLLVERKKAITLRHLLTHTSGATYSFTPDTIKFQKHRGLGGEKQDYAATILDRYDNALLFEPGESWMYSPGLDWIGLLLLRLTGSDLQARMKKYIFTPLSLTTTTFWPTPSQKSQIPHLVTRTPENTLAPFTSTHLNTLSTDCFGGHGVYSNMADYLAVMQSLLSNDGKLLKPSTVEMMFTPQLSEIPAATFTGFASNFGAMLPGVFDPDIELQYGLGGGLQMGDWEEVGRKKGTMFWSGYFNPVWYIDRESDLAWTFGTNMVPPGDAGCKEMQKLTEKALYELLKEKKGGAWRFK